MLHLGANISALICMGCVHIFVFSVSLQIYVCTIYLWAYMHMFAQVHAEAKGQC